MRIPEQTRVRLLERWPVARLATLGDAGRPRLVPIVFAWYDDRLWTPVDGKPKQAGDLARVQDVLRDPRVCVLLDDYQPDWARLWWLRLDGVAEVVTSDDPERDPRLAPAAAALRAKYPQYAEVALFRGRPTALAIQVERTRSWCVGEQALPLV